MKKIESQDLWKLINLGALQVKDDRIVFLSSQAKPDHARNAYQWTLNSFSHGQVKAVKTFLTAPRFCLRSEQAVWLVEDNRLESLDLETGAMHLLAKLPGKTKLQLAAILNQSQVLLVGQVDFSENQPHSDYTVLDELPAYFNGAGCINKYRQHLFIFDLQKKQLKDLAFDPYLHVHDWSLSQDCQQLLFAGDVYQHQRPVQPSLYKLDLGSGQTSRIYGPNQIDVSTSLFFNQSFFLHNQPFLFGIEGQTLGYNTNPQFYRLVGRQPQLAARWDHSLGAWIGTDQALVPGNAAQVFQDKYYFVSTITDHTNLYAFDGQKVELYFKFPGSITAFQFAGSADFYFIGLKPNYTQCLFHVQNHQVHKLYDPNKGFLAAKAIAKCQPINFTATGQVQQHGWVLYPQNFNPQQKYPGLLEIHGGPKTAYGTVFFHEMQCLASQGYFVFFCNPHGSDGQGQAYADIAGHWGENDFSDLMKFTDAVLTQIPQLDAQRLGVLGGSYGGFMTNWIIGHTHRFQAACSQRSIANELSHAFVSDIGPADNFFEDQATLQDDPQGLWQHSPLKDAPQATTPTLFINSDQDYRCPIDEGMQMFHALLWYGVPARMCVFHGENHNLSRSGKPAHRIRRLNEIINWFNHYLQA